MRPQSLEGVLKTSLQVLIERPLGSRNVIVGYQFLENAPISRFLEVGGDPQDQPVRIVIEVASNIVVTALCERLILVVRASTG
jgi:hypothetical protein